MLSSEPRGTLPIALSASVTGSRPTPHFPSSPLQRAWNSCTCVAFLAATFLSGATLAFKLLSNSVSPFPIIFIRSLISLPFLVLLGYWQSGTVFGPKGSYTTVAFRGILSGMDSCISGIAISLLPLSVSTLLLNTHPVFLTVLSWLLRMETVDGCTWIGVAGAMTAQFLIAKPPFLFGGDAEWDTGLVYGTVLCLVGNIARSVGFIIVRRVGEKVPSTVMTSSAILFTALLSLPLAAMHLRDTFHSGLPVTKALLFVAASLEGLNQILIVRSFQIGPSTKAAILSLSRVLIMMALGVLVCAEEITLLHGLSAVILLASIGIIIVRKGEEHQIEEIDEEVPLLPESSKRSVESLSLANF